MLTLDTESQNHLLDQVYSGDYLCGTIEVIDGKYRYDISCGGHVTRNIRVENDCILVLCEVQVFTNNPPRKKKIVVNYQYSNLIRL